MLRPSQLHPARGQLAHEVRHDSGVAVVPHHRVALPAPGLAVREEAAVEPADRDEQRGAWVLGTVLSQILSSKYNNGLCKSSYPGEKATW